MILTKDGFKYNDESVINILSDLQSNIEFEDGVTFGDLFNAVKEHDVLVEVMKHVAICYDIEEFHTQAKLPPIQSDFSHIEFQWHIYLSDVIDLTCDWVGIGNDGESYSISFEPMNVLAALPIKLVEATNIKTTVIKTGNQDIETRKYFTLLDILTLVYAEISFHGSPEATAKVKEELIEMGKDIEAGRVQVIPIDWEVISD